MRESSLVIKLLRDLLSGCDLTIQGLALLVMTCCHLIQPDEATTLFRATTLASTLMEQYMKATATPFVHHALKDTILKIMESKQSCEVDSHREDFLFDKEQSIFNTV